MKIAVVGLGYVGLPLSLQFARSGAQVLGLDVDASKIKALLAAKSYIKHIESSSIAELLEAKQFTASIDFSRVKEVDAIIICVPTPLNKNREPDISYVLETGRSIGGRRRSSRGRRRRRSDRTRPGRTRPHPLRDPARSDRRHRRRR